MYQVCYTRYHVSFYLWLIGSVLKHCKVPKYYEQDCSFFANCSELGCPFNLKQLSFIKLSHTNLWKYLMLLVICKIIGKTHVFQLCNLNHTFSPTYLYIYQINELREKSHYVQRSFCVCVFFYGKKFLTCVKFNSKAIFLCSLWNFFQKFSSALPCQCHFSFIFQLVQGYCFSVPESE